MDSNIINENGKEIGLILRNHGDSLDPILYNAYLTCYEKICESYNSTKSEPWISMRLANYFRGEYYIKKDNNIRAQASFLEALNTDAPRETFYIIPDIKIKCRLLLIYYNMNNSDSGVPILQELMSRNIVDYYQQGLDLEDICTIYTINNDWGRWSSENIYKLKEMLSVIWHNMKKSKSEVEGYDKKRLIFVLTSILLIIEEKWASWDEYKIYLAIIKKINENKHFSLETNLQILMLRTLARLTGELNLPEEENYIKESLRLAKRNNVPFDSKAEIYQAAASFYYGKGQREKGIGYLYYSLDMITREWHACIRYLGKIVYQILDIMQLNFLGCYDTIHKYESIEFAYEKLLQFKALASLAGRERNRILYSGKLNKKLLERIQYVQDKIAYQEVEKICLGRMQPENKENELLPLEADLAEQFPKDISFTDITLEKVQKAIPNNSAIIEYWVYEIDYEKHEFTSSSSEPNIAIDIYVLCKKNNHCSLKRHEVSEGMRVLNESKKFVSILQEGDRASKELKEQLRKKLYHTLIRPVLSFIQGAEKIYIAPDRDLINLPFEILNDERNIQLEKNYDITKIECARDFIFRNINHHPTKGSLIIGNPAHIIRNKRIMPLTASLPFSEVEIKKISNYYNCNYYSGNEASKKRLLSASGYRNIHIATHGYFDSSNEFKKAESVYSSFLIFAGVDDWRQSGKLNADYGNGIVTADEISRMDLRSVELVVLSSCGSGMNRIIESKGFHGLVGAFSEAGVHYVISHLWNAKDFSTAILMDNFYYHYVKENQSPSVALRLAKEYLRNITVKQLKLKGWIDILKSKDEKSARKYEWCYDDERPFKEEVYWGGFSCYRCNG